MVRYSLRRIGVANNAAALRPTLSECIEVVLEHSDALAADVLDALKAPVVHSKAPGPVTVDPDIKRVVLQLVEEAAAVRATFGAELRRLVYQSGLQDFVQSPLGQIEDIRAFDMRELEAQLEQALAQQEVARAVDDVLPLFDALVSALLGWTSVQPGLNPMKPEAYLRALFQTLAMWVPQRELRTRLVRPAAIALGIGLRQLYREVCEYLRSLGVEPVHAVEYAGLDPALRARPVVSELEKTMATLDKLRRLLAGDGSSGGAPTGQRDFTHTMPASLVALQDLKLVEPMIKRLTERQAPPLAATRPGIGGMAAMGRTSSRQEQNRQMGRQLAEEVLRLMLDRVVHDERLAEPVRGQLRSMEPLLVRLAKSDPRFFIDRAHPARQLLDRVVQRSLGYGRDDQEGIAGFAACVSNAIGGLLRSAGDAGACAEAVAVLERNCFEFEESRRKERERERIEREHAEKRQVLAQRFSSALEERFLGDGVPDMVAAFLRGPWATVLAEARLRSAADIADPRGYLAVVDDLVWSVQPPRVRKDYTRLVRLVPRLLARLNEGLVLIRHPREPVTAFLDALSTLHEQGLEDHRRAMARALAALASRGSAATEPAPDLLAPVVPIPAEVTPERRSRPRPPGTGYRPAASPRELQLGDWVDLMLGGVWVRAELTWVSPNRALFMFVSGAGLAHAMSRRTMDRLQTHGRLRLGQAPARIDLILDTAHGLLDAIAATDPDAAPAS